MVGGLLILRGSYHWSDSLIAHSNTLPPLTLWLTLTSLKLSEQNLLMREVLPTAASPRVTRVTVWGEATWPRYTDILICWWSGGVVHILSLPALSFDWLTDTRCSVQTASSPQSSRDHLRLSESAVLLLIVTTEARPCALWSVKIFSFKLNLFTQVTLIPDFPTGSPTLLWLDHQD